VAPVEYEHYVPAAAVLRERDGATSNPGEREVRCGCFDGDALDVGGRQVMAVDGSEAWPCLGRCKPGNAPVGFRRTDFEPRGNGTGGCRARFVCVRVPPCSSQVMRAAGS
jgi:hypothetical protein